MAGTIKLLVDTNAFLQLRDLKDLPWRDLFSDVSAVDLMIGHAVVRELDRHKSGTNQRRRDRSRLALALIEKASSEPDFAHVIKNGSPRIRVVMSDGPRVDWDVYPRLDPSNPDHQLVAEAAAYGDGMSIFSHDTGPRIAARMHGLPAYAPPDNWLLPAEHSDDQRKIGKLERELQQALSRYPTIIASFPDAQGDPPGIRLIKPRLPPLSNVEVSRLTHAFVAKHPRARLAGTRNNLTFAFGGISDAAIERYNDDYAKFEEKVRAFFTNLHLRVAEASQAIPIHYLVANESGVVAEDLRIEYELTGPAFLLPDRAVVGTVKLPEPPSPPKVYGAGGIVDTMPLLHRLHQPRDRDPIGFYWIEKPGLEEKNGVLQCAQFRAKQRFEDSVFLFPTADSSPGRMDLRIHISAANLTAPIEISATLMVVEETADWSDDVVQAILPKEIGDVR